jgi:hypothetical protein
MNMPVIPREEQEVSPSKLLLSPKFPAVRDQESPPSAVANPVAAATACRHRSALSCDDSRAARNELPRMATRPRLAWAAMNNGQLAVRCDGCDEPSRSFVGLGGMSRRTEADGREQSIGELSVLLTYRETVLEADQCDGRTLSRCMSLSGDCPQAGIATGYWLYSIARSRF